MGFFVVVLFDILQTTLWYINNFNYKFPFLSFSPILMGFPGGSDGTLSFFPWSCCILWRMLGERQCAEKWKERGSASHIL